MLRINSSLRMLILVALSGLVLPACSAVVPAVPTPQPPYFPAPKISLVASPTFAPKASPLSQATPTSPSVPTAIPTQDYFTLALKYLTPLPTTTRQSTPVPTRPSTIQPTPTVNHLAKITVRTVLSANEVSPPPLVSSQSYQSGQTEEAYIQAATDLMNLSQGSEEKYLEYVATWVPGTDPKSLGAVWVRRVDLDNDRQPEWLVTVPQRRPALQGAVDSPQNSLAAFRSAPDVAQSNAQSNYLRIVNAAGERGVQSTLVAQEWLGCETAVICDRLILLFEKRSNLFTPVHVFTSYSDSMWFNTPSLLHVDDMNKDGLPEVVLESKWCGASTCGSWFYVGSWDGHAWHNYGQFNQSFAEASFIDRDNDGTIEIVLHSGGNGNAGFMAQRRHTIIYDWTGTEYAQVADIPDNDSRPYFLLVDANTALIKKDAKTALQLATLALEKLGSESCLQMKYDGALVAYAGIEYLLAQFLHGELPEIPLTVSVMQEKCGMSNAYFTAIHILQQAYQYTRDPVKACEAMENYIANYPSPEQAELVPSFYSWERIKICPLKP